MTPLASIFKAYGAQYLNRHGENMLSGHRRAMRDIMLCRSEHLGGHLWWCDHCRKSHYSYHSCKNRHCPQCQHHLAQRWLEKQCQMLLPVEYFMATFTLPDPLRQLVRKHQRQLYHLLFSESAAALQKLAADPRYIGGRLGMLGVLQTWSRTLCYHPHIHYLIPGGGYDEHSRQWRTAKYSFLMPVRALSVIFRAKFRDALKKCGLADQVSPQVWKMDWVVHIKSVGRGEAALKYIASYLTRVAISNRNILSWEDSQVTFRYKNNDNQAFQTMTLDAMEFMRRFLQHVLPKGFQKIRYYGFLRPNNKIIFHIIKFIMGRNRNVVKPAKTEEPFRFKCPECGREMSLIEKSLRLRGPPLAELLGISSNRQLPLVFA